MAQDYRRIIFTPGNHCLRGRENPWESFDVPNNVIYPSADEPRIHRIEDSRILVANLFYDMEFIDPTILGLTQKDVAEAYKKVNDGQHFLKGDWSSFKRMKEKAARLLQGNIDILATHALPHPSLVNFRVPEMTDEIKALAESTGLEFICDPEWDLSQANRYKNTADGFRQRWNEKSFFMGSNLLEDPLANFRDGLTVVHGHHHRNDLRPRQISGKSVSIVTHQSFGITL